MKAILIERAQTVGEEIANAISHGLGFLLAVASLPVLVAHMQARGSIINVVSVCVFSGTMMLLYLVSTIFHALPEGRAKSRLNRLDHSAIYLFIAGSYTPFMLGALQGVWGWTLLGIVWTAAAVGVTAKLLNRFKHPLLSTGLYLAMGWVAVIGAGPMMERVSTAGIVWLVVGGLSYTLGAVVFSLDNRVRYAHFVWHLFVLGGSTCHFFAVLWHSQGLVL